MTKFTFTYSLLVCLWIMGGCKEQNKPSTPPHTSHNENAAPLIYIQPLGNIDDHHIAFVKKAIESFYGYPCIVEPRLKLTKDLLANSGTRYEASKILKKFNNQKSKIIITSDDIACKKGKYPEWGVLGLGYRPGTTCVISTFRMKKKVSEHIFRERLQKVALHEIGHNLGLDHCQSKIDCLMNDAKGTIRQVDLEKMELCKSCIIKIPEHARLHLNDKKI